MAKEIGQIGLFDARIMLRVKTPDQLKRKQDGVRNALKDFGVTVPELIEHKPVDARIEANRWLFDCDCGSGVAVHPDWHEARCLGDGCGRVYTHVQIPRERAALEEALLQLPAAARYWYPGETVEDVQMSTADQIAFRHSVFLGKKEKDK